MPRPSRRHLTPLTLGLGALAAAGVVAAVVVVGPETTATGAQERVVTVSKGVVQATVSGSGNLSPANTMNMSFGASGQVTKVYVKPGEHVTDGQLLARIDPTSAEVDLAEARATLSSAQDTLEAIQSGTTTTATASTATATTATATIASVTARAAQATTSAPATATAPPSTAAPASTTAPQTTTAPSTTATPSTSGGTSGGGAAGGGGSTMSEASAAAAVKSAQLAVDDAEQALAATALRAPAAATVAAVNGAVGDQVSASSGASSSSGTGTSSGGAAGGASGTGAASASSSTSGFITLTQLSRMHLEVSLSESDIDAVEVGQQATVTINAASGEEVAGKVIDIGVLSSSSSSSTGSASAVSYPVTIALTQTTKGLRAGMSATAEIVTSQAEGVVVPTQALRGSTVTLVKAGRRSTRRVQTGVAGDSTTQVVSGLRAGDQVVVTSASAAAGAGATSGAAGTRGTGATGRSGLGGGAAGGFPGGGAPGGFPGGGTR